MVYLAPRYLKMNVAKNAKCYKLIPNCFLHARKNSYLSVRTIKYNIPICGLFSDALFPYENPRMFLLVLV